MSRWWVVTLMLGTPAWGAAQPDSQVLARVSGQVTGQDRARISTRQGLVVVERPVVTLHGIEYSLDQALPRDTVSWTLLSRIEVRTNSAGQGAMVFAAFLGFMGAAEAIHLAQPCGQGSNWDFSCGWPKGYIAAGAVVGAALGAGLGALIGLAIPRWRTVYQSAPERPIAPVISASGIRDWRVGLAVRW